MEWKKEEKLEKKHLIDLEDEDWKPTHVERRSTRTRMEKMDMVYVEASDPIDEIDLQEVMDKVMKVLDPVKGSMMKS